MANWIKLGIYAAAGVGTYEVLRRYGLLKKAGDWLSAQVPDDYKHQAGEYLEKAKQRVGEYGERAQQWADDATEKVRDAVGGTAAAAASATGNGRHTGGSQNITGAGRGTTTTTDEPSGVHVPHTVGRGVVR